ALLALLDLHVLEQPRHAAGRGLGGQDGWVVPVILGLDDQAGRVPKILVMARLGVVADQVGLAQVVAGHRRREGGQDFGAVRVIAVVGLPLLAAGPVVVNKQHDFTIGVGEHDVAVLVRQRFDHLGGPRIGARAESAGGVAVGVGALAGAAATGAARALYN